MQLFPIEPQATTVAVKSGPKQHEQSFEYTIALHLLLAILVVIHIWVDLELLLELAGFAARMLRSGWHPLQAYHTYLSSMYH